MNPPLHAARVFDRKANLFGCKLFSNWSSLSASVLLTIAFPVLNHSAADAKAVRAQTNAKSTAVQPELLQSELKSDFVEQAQAEVSQIKLTEFEAPEADLSTLPAVDSRQLNSIAVITSTDLEALASTDLAWNQTDIASESTLPLPDLDQLIQNDVAIESDLIKSDLAIPETSVNSAFESSAAPDSPAPDSPELDSPELDSPAPNLTLENSASSNFPTDTLIVPTIAQSESADVNLRGDRLSRPEVGSRDSQDLANPFIQMQGVYTLQGSESSARGRVSAGYVISPNVLVGGTVDVTSGNAFADSPETGIDLNELYVAVSPSELPNLRFVAGMLDLTSYFDRNSFAKDAATQFLNPVFQSNSALTAAGLGSRPAILLNWSVVDPLEIKVAGFSSDRDLSDFALDGFAAEAALRLDNFILRGTYITDRDADQDSGFDEIYQLSRGGSDFGLSSGDREEAYGVNAEYFIPEINLGLFARYGWYENLELDRGGSTYSLGFNLLDLFMPADRLGLAYGRSLSNDDLRQGNNPDAWELFYDFRITPNLRAGVTLQSTHQFSETIGGLRIRADFDSNDLGRLFR